jgi:protoporphyrinogen oxidase
MKVTRHLIIGAGPAGLTAAYELTKKNQHCLILEADYQVGGISKTVERDGWRFDLGGHRFFSKDSRVNALWDEILDSQNFLERPRLSRILYKGRYFAYPLKPMNALRQLGLIESLLCVSSFVACKLKPPKDQTNFEGWVAARFGWRLYRTFFKTYTEKVWGVPATEIQADWAAQRIKSLSLWKAIKDGMIPAFLKRNVVTSLISTFKYPKFGPGMMWEKCAKLIENRGGEIIFGQSVVGISKDKNRLLVTTADGQNYVTEHIYSSMPINQLVGSLKTNLSSEVQMSVKELKHRDFLTVAITLKCDSPFPDNWIYIHTPEVKVGRIQNFGSWSPYLVQEGMSCLGLEYFLNISDEMWIWEDEALVRLALVELKTLGLIRVDDFIGGYVVRVPKAYPVYDEGYSDHVKTIRTYLEIDWPQIHPMGRNGMHRYNNQDHSMLTAMLSVENVLDGTRHDIWSVNLDDEYHEETKGEATKGTGRSAPVFSKQKSS